LADRRRRPGLPPAGVAGAAGQPSWPAGPRRQGQQQQATAAAMGVLEWVWVKPKPNKSYWVHD